MNRRSTPEDGNRLTLNPRSRSRGTATPLFPPLERGEAGRVLFSMGTSTWAGCICAGMLLFGGAAWGQAQREPVRRPGQGRERTLQPQRPAPQRPVQPQRQTATADEQVQPQQQTGNQPARENEEEQAGENPQEAGTPDRPRTTEPAPQGQRPQAPAKPRDRIDDLVKSLDPEVLARLAGAEVTVEMVGDQVILAGPEEAVRAIELMIRALEVESEAKAKVLQIVQVTERDANEISRQVQQAVRDAKKFPAQKTEDQVSITALANNILLVAALPEDIEQVVDIIKQVDAVPDPLGKIELMRFEIEHRKATDVAKELEKVITTLRKAAGAKAEQSKLQIIPNNASNTITVTARESEREKIQALINEIDVEPKKGFGDLKLTVFPLIHSKASEMSKVIQDLLKTEVKAQQDAVTELIIRLRISKATPSGEIIDLPPLDMQRPMRIIADDGTNSLIVATAEENVVPMGELIRLMDGVPLAEEFTIRVFPMRFADAESVGETLKKMFDDGKKLTEDPDGGGKGGSPSGDTGKALVYNIGIAADVRTNTLIASGRPEQLKLIEQIVGEVDRPATALKFPLKLIPLEFTDATQLSKTITELFDQRLEAAQNAGSDKSALERERIFLSVDLRTNSLVLSASEENFAEISGIAKQLDTKPSRLFDQIRILRCERLNAVDLKTKIEELWKRKADMRREAELLEDIPVVAVDERSNALLIASSIEDYDEIQRLVKALDSQPMIDDTRLFKLEFADSTVIAELLKELFDGLAGQSESFKAPTIIPDPRSNALIVAATRDGMERVADVVKRLDVEAGPLTAIFRVYTLRHASASQLANRVQELFDSRKEGDQKTSTPVVILAEESSNSLVCSASRDDHEVLTGLLELLDKPSTLARQFGIFPLKLAKAATVAEKLESLFKAQGDGATGRADAIAAEADERTNSIIVWASPTQMANIAEVIAKLDTSSPVVEMMVRVIQLKQALAEDFAKLLEETLVGENAGADDEKAIIVSFLEKNAKGDDVVRKLLRQDIKIKPDPRTNSLMVMAPADSMAMLEAMIRDFDRIRPITSEIRLFPLINSDSKTMADQLTELFKAEGGTAEGEAKSQLVFGDITGETELASVGQELRFAADTRTNTLIVAGAPVYLQMVEDLVHYLDSQAAEDRITEVIPTKYRTGSELATAVKGFVDQELAVVGEGEDEESRSRRQERQVSIESLGDAEKGSNALVVGTSRRAYQQTMDMIQALDRPEPQVMISVLIAEVTLSDNVDLGVEIAGQDLHFSEDAIVGPNGIIQGEDFDYVSGTDLGAAGLGLGGFNFTITGEDFSFLFRALQQDSRLEVLSRPLLMVRNGDEGKITIADQVPIVESSQLSDTGQTQSTIGREDVGIVLTATPTISPDGYVTIKMKQEISNISGENIQLTEGVSSPVFSTREVDTNITVRDGETVVIGGLIQSRDSHGENKVPIIGDIPGLGWLFRTTSVKKSRTELLVVLTVDILRTVEDVKAMSVEQRDKFELPDTIRQNPLMEGLRIKPQDTMLGPKDISPTTRVEEQSLPGPRKEEREQFGPRPKTYGPAIPRPASTTTTSASAKVYGPRIARGAESEQN